MDRRSWLWRRKSSEKSPSGETESSGSVSSHSERFSDDQTLSNHNIQSPEVTSKAAPDDEFNDSVKLSEKLSVALRNICAKEELVKQHAKVAEEAVSGWEKAENEVVVLKKQNDALTQKNSILEERVGHLDGALKECLRQLRQAREDQEEKIRGAIADRSSEWELKKSELESQMSELHNQLQNAKSVEAAERENSDLKLKLLSKDEELEIRIRERDLSTYAAEAASKQHLESIKKVAKLEAECRRLKAVMKKAASCNDHQSVTTSSVYVESSMDSQSDNGERTLFMESYSARISGFGLNSVDERSLMVPSVEIDLMDDFLEMEKLAALPEMNSGNRFNSRIDNEESLLRDELDAVTKRANKLDDSLKKIASEKASLEIALDEYKTKLMASENQLKQTEVTLVGLKAELVMADAAKRDAQKQVELSDIKLKNLKKQLDEAEGRVAKVEDKLNAVNELKSVLELQLEDVNLKKAESESRVEVMEVELQTLHSSISALEKEVERERNHSREAVAKCDTLEAEISRMESNSLIQRSAIIEEFRTNQDEELAVAATKFAECQKTIASLGHQLKSLATFEDFWIDSETSVAVI